MINISLVLIEIFRKYGEKIENIIHYCRKHANIKLWIKNNLMLSVSETIVRIKQLRKRKDQKRIY